MHELPNPDWLRRQALASGGEALSPISDDHAYEYLEWSFALFYGPLEGKVEGN